MQDGMAIDQELCMTGTQIAAEMLTGLGNDPSNGMQSGSPCCIADVRFSVPLLAAHGFGSQNFPEV